jgi:hypothetical protein
MVVVAMVMGPTILMVITKVEHHIWVEVNLHRTTKLTIPIDTNLMLLGALEEMDLSIVIGVLEDVKES